MKHLNLGGRGAAIALYAFAVFFIACSAAVAAAITAAGADDATAVASGGFVKKDMRISGGWEIVAADDGTHILKFDDAFKTRNGPDLKVFLSPQSVTDVSGDTAADGAVLLGQLVSNKGEQTYVIPADVDLSAFHSVLVHCEAYSKLWGGADLK